MHEAAPAVAPEVPEKIALVMRRQRRSLRALRAEGIVLPALLLVFVLSVTALDGVVPMGLGLALAFIPVPLVAAVLLRLDRFEPEPTRLLLRTFLWGAGAATAIALVVNTGVGILLGEDAATIASAPVVEEVAKALALLFVIRRRPGFLDGVHDGIVSKAGPRTGAPNRCASAATPPTWSAWWCVTRTASSSSRSAARYARIGAASPGSTTAARRSSRSTQM